MDIAAISALVTGAGSGLGRATALRLARRGAKVVGLDLNVLVDCRELQECGVHMHEADVLDSAAVAAGLEIAAARAPLRAVVHCAGRGGPLRVLDKEGAPAALEAFELVVRTNLVGSFNVIRLAAQQMAGNDLEAGDRGVMVLTASIAAYEGQVGQIAYASSKAGVAGMTLVAARDLAHRAIRVCSIAPGIFDTPMLARVPEDARNTLGKSVPHPSRLGVPDEFAALAQHIIENQMLNGEVIRLDGALRMAPR
jgi:NAD(P)-dependent dehydrogenase (short-subunit alcohol dehydrogenase family)